MKYFLLFCLAVSIIFSCNSNTPAMSSTSKNDSGVSQKTPGSEPVNNLELAQLTFKRIMEIAVSGKKNKLSEDSMKALAAPDEKLLDSQLVVLTEVEKNRYEEYRGNVLDSIATGKIK